MKKYILLLIAVLCSCTSYKSVTDKNNSKTIDVSIISVIANPEKYNGKKIRLKGYFTYQFEEHMLYLHKADYDASLYKNALFLFTNKEFLTEQGIDEPYRGYIVIEGTFTTDKGVFSYANTGALEDITMMYRLPKRNSVIDEPNMD